MVVVVPPLHRRFAPLLSPLKGGWCLELPGRVFRFPFCRPPACGGTRRGCRGAGGNGVGSVLPFAGDGVPVFRPPACGGTRSAATQGGLLQDGCGGAPPTSSLRSSVIPPEGGMVPGIAGDGVPVSVLPLAGGRDEAAEEQGGTVLVTSSRLPGTVFWFRPPACRGTRRGCRGAGGLATAMVGPPASLALRVPPFPGGTVKGGRCSGSVLPLAGGRHEAAEEQGGSEF